MNSTRQTYGGRLRSQLVDVLQEAGLDPQSDPVFGELLEAVAIFVEKETLRSFKAGISRGEEKPRGGKPARATGGRS